MTISFDTIPANALVPLWWAEVTSAQTPYTADAKLLLVGAMAPDGNGSSEVPYILSGTAADKLFGRDSMLASMYRHAYGINPLGEIWGIATPAPDAGVKATGSIHVTGDPAGKSGICSFRIGANLIQVRVNPADTTATLALKISQAINGNNFSYVNASRESTDHTMVDLTAVWSGTTGNKIVISTRWWGKSPDLSNLLTITQMNGGAGVPSLDNALAALGDQAFDVIVSGFSDGATLNNFTTFMDNDSGRWSPTQQIYGHVIAAKQDDFADLVTFGGGYNDPHLSIWGFQGSMNPEWEWAAEIGAQHQMHLGNGPPECSRPLQGLELSGIEPSYADVQWFDVSERQSLYEAGIATVRVDQYRNVLIDREVTTYKTNANGDFDASFRDTTTLFQIMFFVRSMQAAVAGAFPRAALTDDESGIPGFASPGQIKDVIIHNYSALQALGLVENVTLFAANLIVERDATDANRVNVMMTPDVVNQLRILAVLVQSNLQLTDSSFSPAAN